ncbi:ABC transporter permease [candidate division CSSED10-310 bacterium]|uniref:ABC transporter permease n=1 Tax=candidate division CSSED10-310 bacterium TaxID=2855610 RepID=A0ABV6YYS2_UNCC1
MKVKLADQNKLPVVIRYTPGSKINQPLLLFREMWQDLKASRELAWRLFVRDISAQYRQTLLGYFWAIFPPLVTSAVFILLNSSRVLNIEGLTVPYPIYVLMGTVFWQIFVDALNTPLRVINEAKAMLAKINMPKEALIISGIGRVLFSFGIKFILLVVVFIIYRVDVNWTVIFVPIPLLGLLLLGTMLGVLLIPIGVLYKDIDSALLIATSGLIFLTPVAYPPTVGGLLGKIMMVNPVTPLLLTAKELVLNGFPENLIPFVIVFSVTVIFLFLGWIIYRLALPIIIERIGS